jgi:dihydroflavonol-4-reductase
MTIAVTGASGYVGQVLIPRLTSSGHSLRVLFHRQQPDLAAAIVQGDLLNKDSLGALVHGADVVIHLAAVISIQDFPDDHALEVNIIGTRLLLEAAWEARVRRFIYLSSIAAFQQLPGDEPMDEGADPVIAPFFNYDYSKSVAQRLVLEYQSKGMEVVILAPSAILGPFDREPSFLGKAIIAMYRGRVPALFPGGVDFVDVRDVAGAIESAVDRGIPGQVYLLSGQWVSLKTLSLAIGKLRNRHTALPVLPIWLILGCLPLVRLWAKVWGAPPYYTRQALYNLIYSNKHINNARAKSALQFDPRPFEDTLKDTVAWFHQNGMLTSS